MGVILWRRFSSTYIATCPAMPYPFTRIPNLLISAYASLHMPRASPGINGRHQNVLRHQQFGRRGGGVVRQHSCDHRHILASLGRDRRFGSSYWGLPWPAINSVQKLRFHLSRPGFTVITLSCKLISELNTDFEVWKPSIDIKYVFTNHVSMGVERRFIAIKFAFHSADIYHVTTSKSG